MNSKLCYRDPDDPETHKNIGVIPGCFDDKVKIRSGKLYARINILKGEYIEISRSILLNSEHVIHTGDLESLVFFRHGKRKRQAKLTRQDIDEYEFEVNEFNEYSLKPKSSIVSKRSLFLMGYGSLYRPNTTSNANVNYSWWNYDEFVKSSMNSKTQTISDDYIEYAFTDNRTINSNVFSNEECVNNKRLWVAFYANRDIQKNEELTIDIDVDPLTLRKFVKGEMSKYCF